MIVVPVEDTPAALVRLSTAAAAMGWSVTATAADGPPRTVALRFGHDTYRAYGVWQLTDKGGVSFRNAGCRHIPPGTFKTLRALKTYLGVS